MKIADSPPYLRVNRAEQHTFISLGAFEHSPYHTLQRKVVHRINLLKSYSKLGTQYDYTHTHTQKHKWHRNIQIKRTHDSDKSIW